ncbi:hypothetical protein [Swingsia samuiensis]|uniref:Uncharacterized protein n=1 Tax=Swingsia samuiensis TaxID=1293412 RepID=A0A4Y6UGV1_9PROT|nr:hypothetical protein [Swingsia samuiensis]QDH16783.1 hypothetical protein E3D00_03770 [Swingsia samuiensis]
MVKNKITSKIRIFKFDSFSRFIPRFYKIRKFEKTPPHEGGVLGGYFSSIFQRNKNLQMKGDRSVLFGSSVRDDRSLAFGSSVRGDRSLTVGSSVRGERSLAFGSSVRGDRSLVVGSSVRDDRSLAFGSSVRGDRSLTVGSSVRGERSLAFGSSVRGDRSLVVGSSVRGDRSLVVGSSVKGDRSLPSGSGLKRMIISKQRNMLAFTDNITPIPSQKGTLFSKVLKKQKLKPLEINKNSPVPKYFEKQTNKDKFEEAENKIHKKLYTKKEKKYNFRKNESVYHAVSGVDEIKNRQFVNFNTGIF